MEELLRKRVEKAEQDLLKFESDIESKEDEYISRTWAHGNVIRGWDNFIRRAERSERAKMAAGNEGGSNPGGGGNDGGGMTGGASGKGAPNQKVRKARTADHIFSLSSSSSKIRREHPDLQIPKRQPAMTKRKKKRGG